MSQDDLKMKGWVDGITVPEPSADFERRIIAAAALHPAPEKHTWNWTQLFWPIRAPQLALAAVLAVAVMLVANEQAAPLMAPGEDVLAGVELVEDPFEEMEYAQLM